MLKTIKTTKHMRLDELIKYCIENDIEDRTFNIGENTLTTNDFAAMSNPNYKSFRVSGSGNFKISGYINKNDLFPVEVEEEITKDMRFIELVERYELIEEKVIGAIQHKNVTMRDVLSQDYITGIKILQIYALIDNKLELIWEREEE